MNDGPDYDHQRAAVQAAFAVELLRAPALPPALDHGMSLQSSLGITKKTQNSTHAAFAVELLCAPAHTAQTRGVQK